MRKTLIAAMMLAGLAALPSRAALQDAAPSVERIAAAHLRALGGMERIAAIRSFVLHGTYHEGVFDGKTYVAQMRPFYRVIGGMDDPLKHQHEGYDGSAWEYYPDPGIVVRTVGAAARSTRHTAMFNDALVSYREMGTVLESGGVGMLSGRRVYVLHATLADGFAEDIYVDPKSWMIAGYASTVQFHAFGAAHATHMEMSDYRPEGGLMWAHRAREVDTVTGKVLDESTLEAVEINPDLPPAQFSPPVWERTPVQAMVQRIYDERTDPVAVMATYRDVRRAFPGIDSANAVDFVGYQCLKMGETGTAVTLLTQNALDYPNSARVHFGLGRALETAGKTDAARAEYDRALEIDPNFVKARTARDAQK